MKKIEIYILTKESKRSYSEGISLLKSYSTNNKETAFLNIENPTTMHWNMLINKLTNILRILKQKAPVQEKTIVQKPIIIQKKDFFNIDGNSPVLARTKGLTNKLLSRKWLDLDKIEQVYFNNDQSLFASKKKLLFRNSQIESRLKSLHASLPHAKNDAQRKKIAIDMTNLKTEQNLNWENVDIFGLDAPKQEDTSDLAVTLLKKRNNLRSQIAKLKTLVKDTKHKNYKKRCETLADAEEQIKQIDAKTEII